MVFIKGVPPHKFWLLSDSYKSLFNLHVFIRKQDNIYTENSAIDSFEEGNEYLCDIFLHLLSLKKQQYYLVMLKLYNKVERCC